MAFTDQELEWAGFSGVTSAQPYDGVRDVVPFDEFGGLSAAVCLFNPIREQRTGRIVAWASLDPESSRQALVNRVELAAKAIDRAWDRRLVAPLLGAPDPLCWTVLADILPHGPVKAVLFPMNDVNELELDWASLATRLVTNDYEAPVPWWDQRRTFLVASPWESVLTYVCGSVSLIEQIAARDEIETERII